MIAEQQNRALKYFTDQLSKATNKKKAEYYQQQIDNLQMDKKTITLLDGKEYNKKDILEKMSDDNYYYGELNELALSSSSLKLLLDSPKSYYFTKKYGQETTQAIRTGHLLHLAILEPEKYDKLKFVEVQSKNTKAYKEAAAEHGKANVFTALERKETERLADAFLKNPTAINMLNDSETEVAGLVEIDGFAFRAKADILKNKGGIVDLKTTVSVADFNKSAYRYKYYLQVAIYCKAFNCSYKDFTFLVLGKNTLDIGVFKVSKEFYELGLQELKKGIELYKTYIREDFDINDYTIQGTL